MWQGKLINRWIRAVRACSIHQLEVIAQCRVSFHFILLKISQAFSRAPGIGMFWYHQGSPRQPFATDSKYLNCTKNTWDKLRQQVFEIAHKAPSGFLSRWGCTPYYFIPLSKYSTENILALVWSVAGASINAFVCKSCPCFKIRWEAILMKLPRCLKFIDIISELRLTMHTVTQACMYI